MTKTNAKYQYTAEHNILRDFQWVAQMYKNLLINK